MINALKDYHQVRLVGSGFRSLLRPSAISRSITDLRAFFGLCQQVGNFSDQIAASLDALSPLLKKGFHGDTRGGL